jgi:hypothetical protein
MVDGSLVCEDIFIIVDEPLHFRIYYIKITGKASFIGIENRQKIKFGPLILAKNGLFRY